MGKKRLRWDAANSAKGIFRGIFLLLFLVTTAKSFAATITSTGTGNWGDASTWSSGTVPTASDAVVIRGDDEVTVNISNAACLSLAIGNLTKANASIVFNPGTSQLTVSGVVTFGSNGNGLRSGSIDMTFGGRLICQGFLVNNFSSFTSGTGTVELTATTTIPADITMFNNLVINTSGTVTLNSIIYMTGTLTLTQGTFAAGNNLSMGTGSSIARNSGVMTGRLQGTGVYDISYSGNTKTMGPERTGTGLNDITVNLNSGQTVTQDTILSITDLTVTAGTYSTSTYTLGVGGNLSVTGTLTGSADISLTGSGTTISGSGSVTSSGNLRIITGNKTISSSSNLTISSTIAIIGAVTLENDGTVTLTGTGGVTGTLSGSSWNNAANASLTIAGPLLSTGNLIATASPNTITYNSTSAGQTINGSTYHHLVINKSGQTATLGGNVTVNGNLTVSSGTLDVSASNYSLTLKGNFTNSGTFTRRSGTVTFSGTSAQAISSATAFYNLTINSSGGVTLGGDATINGTLTLTNGKITTTSSYKVIIPSTGSVSGGSSSSFVNGKIQKNFATGSSVARIYEVGNGTSYLPLTLTFSTVTSGGDIAVTTTSGDHAQLSASCISVSGSLNKYWTITNSGVSPVSYSAVFNFSAGDLDAGASPSELRVASYASSTWTNLTVSNRTSTSITATGLSGFGDFAVGEYNPKVSSQPASVTACASDNVTYSLTATGSGLSYQWQESTNSGSSFADINNGGVYSGATTASLTLTGVSLSMSGYQYRCIVSNTGGCSNTDTSNAVSLTIANSFTINTQPSSGSVCSGSATSFSVVATGAVSGYQWQLNTGSGWNNISNNATYSGATTATLSISSVSTGMNGYQYRCAISSNCGPGQNTSGATLTTFTAPSISSQPTNQNACEDNDVSFSVTASGSNITYQWEEYNGSSWSSITNGGIYSGATSATLTLTAIPYTKNGYQYRCTVSGSCTPPVTSNAVSVTLTQRPYFTSNPSDVTIRYNTTQNASFSASASGAGTITYQWQVSTDNGANFSNITNGGIYSGATTGTLSITGATLGMDRYQYRCMASGTCSPSRASSAAVLYISFHYEVIANTNWSALNPTPTTTSTIEVKSGATLTVDVSNAVVGSIQLGRKPNPNKGSGTLAFNANSVLSVYGAGKNISVGDQGENGSIIMTNGGTLNCNGFVVDGLGTWAPGTGTVNFTGSHTIATDFTTFNNLIISNTLINLSANTTVGGYLQVDTLSTFNTSTFTLGVAGNLTVNGTLSGTGAVTLTGSGTSIGGNGTINNTNTLTLSTGNKTISSTAHLTTAGTVAISGAITVTNNGTFTNTASGGITGSVSGSTWINSTNSSLTLSGPLLATGTLTASATGNTVSYNSSTGAQTVKSGTYHNLTIEKTGQTATPGGAITVNGTLYLAHGILAATTNLTMGSGSAITVHAGSITGTLQGSNAYDVTYINNSKSTSGELGGPGLRNITENMVSGETLTLDRALAPAGNITISSGTLDVTASNYAITAKGNFTNNSVFTARSGVVTFSGTSAQTISGSATTDFYQVIINNSSGVTLSGNVSLTDSMTLLSGTLAAGTYFTPGSLSSITVNGGTMSGTVQGTNSYDVFYTGNSKTTAGALTGAGLRDVYMQLTSGQTLTLGSGLTINRDLKLTTGTLDVSTSNYALNVGRNFTNNATFTARSGKVTFNGSTAQTVSGATTFYRMTVNNSSTGVTLSSAVTIGDTLRLQNGLLAAGSNLTMGSNTNIRVQKGTMSGTLQGSNAYNVIYTDSSKTTTAGLSGTGLQDVIVALDANRTVTLGTAFSASRDVTITSGTLDVSASNYGITVKRNFTNNGTFTARSGTVTFSGTSAQTISGSTATTFYNLTLNNSTGLSLSSVNATVGNTLTLTSGTLAVGTNTLTLNASVSVSSGALSSSATGTINYNQSSNGQSIIAMDYGNLTFSNFNKTLPSTGTVGINGTFTPGSATGHTVTGSTVDFKGSSAQNIPAFTFNNLTISGGSTKTLTGDATVNGILTFSSGLIATGSNKVIISSSGSVSGADSGKYVNGNLQKNVATGATVARTFEVGNSSSYLPVTLSFNTVGTAGNVTVNTTDGDHTQIGSSCLNSSKSVNRYWTVSNSGTVFTSYDATVTFVAGDLDAGVTTSNLKIAVYNSGWSNPVAGTRTSTTTAATGITSVGAIQVGEPVATVISQQPVSSTICFGGNASLSVSATGSGLTYQWQESTNGGSSYSNVSNGGIYSGATAAALSFTNPLTSMSGYKYRCIISASCVANDTTSPATLTVNITGLWLGLTTTWNSATNWCGGVPTSSTDVTIPATALNMPTTSGSITVNNLTIESGATLTMGGALTVNGDVTNDGTLTIGASTLDLKGAYTGSGTLTGGSSSNLTISGTASAATLPGISLNNLTINRSNGAAMGGNITVAGTLTLTSGTFSVGNYRLTLNGNAIAGTAANLSTTSGSALIIGGSASSLTLPSSVANLKTLSLNNSNGFSLSAALTLADSLIFQSGKLTLGDYDLTLSNSGTITGYDSTHYIITKNSLTSGGILSRYVANNDTFVIFPVGTGTSYSPAKIKLTAGSTADNFKVRVVNNIYDAGTSGTQLTTDVLNRTWMIDEATAGGSNATVNLGWVPLMEGSNFNSANVAVSHYTGGQWTHATSFGNYSTVEDLRWRSASGYTSFSPFSVVDGDMGVNMPFTLKTYFECCYMQNMGEMSTALNAYGYLPLSQPYNTAPWNYSGNESVTSIPNSNVVDWVLIELRDAANGSAATSSTSYARQAGFILKDGSIVGTDGVTPITFNVKPVGNYFVIIHHRNHLAVMAGAAITYQAGNFTLDLTNSNNIYGGTTGVSLIGSGVYGMTSGMVDGTDEQVNATDAAAAWNNKNKAGGYYLWDCTLDGVVDASDRDMIYNNLNKQTQVPQ